MCIRAVVLAHPNISKMLNDNVLRCTMRFYKYQGAGNDFLIADNRNGYITEKDGVLTAVLEDGSLWTGSIADLCDRRYGVGADGLMLLDAGSRASAASGQVSADNATDFHMTYFNSDGSGGMMCGNGGRCIVAFAQDCGVEGELLENGVVKYIFTAADGLHEAFVLEAEGEKKIISLRMKDVSEIHKYEVLTGVSVPSDGAFLDTGTRHYVRFVDDVESYDVVGEGRDIRYNARELQPVGANVNFVQPKGELLMVRTYEKGVEDETFACGTGIVASALAAYSYGVAPASSDMNFRVRYRIRAKRDALAVDFIPGLADRAGSDVLLASDIHLTGPAAKIAEIFLT